MNRQKSGFTLIELMVAVICMAILMVPIVWVYRGGTRAALTGLVKAEITGEARNILRQVKADLKYSVFFLDYSRPLSQNQSDFFPLLIGGNHETLYTIFRFPIHGSLDDFIESSGTGTAYRIPVKITYELKKEGEFFYSLYRTEGKSGPVCMSKRVNFFEIEENSFSPPRTSWLVSLQLADVVKNVPTDSNVQQVQATLDLSPKALDRKLSERTQGIQIADYFEVVGSEYYAVFRKSCFVPNWQTLFQKF